MSTTLPARQCALLVDGDNLRGQSWSVILEKARTFGRLNVARVYMDFQSVQDGGLAARAVGFELVHVLGKRSSNGFKSMVDVALATDAMAILYENPHIECLILGSGDADFMPVFRHWRRQGKQTVALSVAGKIAAELAQFTDEIALLGGAGSAPAAASDAAPTPSRRAPSRRTKAAAAPVPPPLPPAAPIPAPELRAAILELSGMTRLTDRETNSPIVRSEWILEELPGRFPDAALPDLDTLRSFIVANVPELEPVHAGSTSYLVGQAKKADEGQKADDAEVFGIFGELCREALPGNGAWIPMSALLNEGKRLLEEGAQRALPTNRPTGWFRSLLEKTDGIELRPSSGGHFEVRRVPRRG